MVYFCTVAGCAFSPGRDNPNYSFVCDGKESACNAGDLGSIPGLGKFSGGGNGNPFQYSCLENPMDRQRSLAGCSPWSREELDALEKEMATHSSVLAWRIPGTGEPDGLLSMGSHRVGHD